MSTTDTARRQAILTAALAVFASEGFHKATIKQVAQAAGLRSPSLIYWYFKDKQELLHAVMAELSPPGRQAADPAALMDQPPETVLPLIMRSYYAALDQPHGAALVRLLFSEAVRTPAVAATLLPTQQAVVRFVVAYLARQVALGRLRAHDPQAAARHFLGAMFAYVLSREILPGLGEGLPARAAYVEQTVAIFLDGLRAPPAPKG